MTEPHESEAERMERALETIDQGKRETMRKLVVGTVFVVPVVASFAISGLAVGTELNNNSHTS